MGCEGTVEFARLAGDDLVKVPDEYVFVVREPVAFVWGATYTMTDVHGRNVVSILRDAAVSAMHAQLMMPFWPNPQPFMRFDRERWERRAQTGRDTYAFARCVPLDSHRAAFDQLVPGAWMFLRYHESGMGEDSVYLDNSHILRTAGVTPVATVEWECWT